MTRILPQRRVAAGVPAAALGIVSQLRIAISASNKPRGAIAEAAGILPAQLADFLKRRQTITLEAAERLCSFLRLGLYPSRLRTLPQEALALRKSGLSYTRIAIQLGISSRTAIRHCKLRQAMRNEWAQFGGLSLHPGTPRKRTQRRTQSEVATDEILLPPTKSDTCQTGTPKSSVRRAARVRKPK